MVRNITWQEAINGGWCKKKKGKKSQITPTRREWASALEGAGAEGQHRATPTRAAAPEAPPRPPCGLAVIANHTNLGQAAWYFCSPSRVCPHRFGHFKIPSSHVFCLTLSFVIAGHYRLWEGSVHAFALAHVAPCDPECLYGLSV